MSNDFQFETVVQDSAQVDVFSIVLYGEGKIGKTETVSRLPATAVMPLEPGGIDHISGFKMNVFKPRGKKRFDNMTEFVAGCAHIAKSQKANGQSIRCVVIDGATFFTGDQVRMLAHEKGWKDPRAAYRVVTDQMRTAVSILLNSGLSVIATGHHRATQGAEAKAIADALKQRYNKEKSVVSLDLNPALMVPFIGGFSHIGYCYRKGGQTMVLFRAVDTKDAQIVAGSRGDIFPQTMVLSTGNLIDVMRQAKAIQSKPEKEAPPEEHESQEHVTKEVIAEIEALGAETHGDTWDAKAQELVSWASKGNAGQISELTPSEAGAMLGVLKGDVEYA